MTVSAFRYHASSLQTHFGYWFRAAFDSNDLNCWENGKAPLEEIGMTLRSPAIWEGGCFRTFLKAKSSPGPEKIMAIGHSYIQLGGMKNYKTILY
jgi:hypothetical protein